MCTYFLQELKAGWHADSLRQIGYYILCYNYLLYVTTHTQKKNSLLQYRSICYAGIVQTDGRKG